MLLILVTSLLMNSYFGLSAAVFLNASSSIAVVAGKPAELLCDPGDGSDVQYWDHFSPTASSGAELCSRTRLYNGIEIRTELKSNMNWTQNAKGKWVLHIVAVNVSSSGLYKCERSEKGIDSLKYSSGTILELIVLASDPQCNISQDVFKEGEYIEIWCSLEYFGSMAPVMEWTSGGVELDVTSCSRIVYNVTNTEVTSKLCVKANSSLHNSKYSCKCYFKPSSYEFKVPDYQYTWTSPILLVKYPSRYIDIVPEKKIFHPGETLSCSADGYPNPDYKWGNLEDRSSQIGPVLTVTKDMIRDTEYIYECIASNSENDIGIRRNTTFTVKASFSVLSATTISTGILSILLLIAILVIVLEYIKGIRRRIGNRQPADNNADIEKDVSHNSAVLRDDNAPGINVEDVSTSSESNPYDEVHELTESAGNEGALDPIAPSGHSDGCYMELHGRSPAIPSVYTSLEEAVQ